MDKQQLATYRAICQEVAAAKATLVAVSKTQSVDKIQALYELGQRDFGENRDAELVEKQALLPQDIHWHFIGHLQRNKVKNIVPFVHLIHAVDSERLLREIDKQAGIAARSVDVLLQFHIADEDSKYGLLWPEASALMESLQAQALQHCRITGVMGMATYTDIDEQIAAEFEQLSQYFERLKADYFPNADYFKLRSMGMSGDYPIALQKGSNLVRIGSLLFG